MRNTQFTGKFLGTGESHVWSIFFFRIRVKHINLANADLIAFNLTYIYDINLFYIEKSKADFYMDLTLDRDA